MKKLTIWCMGALLTAGLSVQATTMWDDTFALPSAVWDDDFSAASINTNMIEYAPAPSIITQTGGQLVLDTGDPGIGPRSQVRMLSDETGAITTFNGADLYDFYDHQVSARFDIASIAGTPNGVIGFNVFYFVIGDDATDDYFPQSLDNGVGFSLQQLNTGGADWWRLSISTHVGEIETADVAIGNLSGLPTAMVFTLVGTSVFIDVEGATFTASGWPRSNGDMTLSGALVDLSASISEYNLVFGAGNKGIAPVTAATVVTLDAFKATVGGGLNNNLTPFTHVGTVLQGAGQLVMDTSVAGGSAQAAVNTLTDETGSITTFDGANLYDFYNHQVSARFDIASITGTPGGHESRNVFYFVIGDDSEGNYAPAAGGALDNGLGFRLEQLDVGGGDFWRLELSQFTNTVETANLMLANLDGLPSALIYTLDGDQGSIQLEGATAVAVGGDTDWTGGGTYMSGSLPDISTHISGYSLAFGAYNWGIMVTNKTVVTLDAFSISVLARNFSTWATSWGGINIGSETDDPDGDLLDNLSEYGLGGDPTNATDRGFVPSFEDDGSGMVYVYAQRTDDANLSYYLETTVDLIVTPWADSGYTELGTDVTGGLFNFVTNTLPTTANKTFLRLRIENN